MVEEQHVGLQIGAGLKAALQLSDLAIQDEELQQRGGRPGWGDREGRAGNAWAVQGCTLPGQGPLTCSSSPASRLTSCTGRSVSSSMTWTLFGREGHREDLKG